MTINGDSQQIGIDLSNNKKDEEINQEGDQLIGIDTHNDLEHPQDLASKFRVAFQTFCN